MYEEVQDNAHMNTMDVRIKITQDVIKESDHFNDEDSSKDNMETNLKASKSDIVSKAKNFKKKCLARIFSLPI